MSKKPRTPIGRIAWVSVFKPRKQRKDNSSDADKFKYEITLYFKKSENPDMSVFNSVIDSIVKTKFGGSTEGLKMPVKDCDKLLEAFEGGFVESKPRDEELGHFKATFKSNADYPPRVLGPNKEEILPSDVKSGDYGVVYFSAWGYNVSGSKGIAFNLNGFQLARKGDPWMTESGVSDDDFEVLGEPIHDAENPVKERNADGSYVF